MTSLDPYKNMLYTSRQYLYAVLDAVGDRWQTPVYSDGAQWNVHQLLIHLVVAHQGLFRQLVRISNNEEAIPADFDVNRYNKRSVEKKAELTVTEARADLDASQKELLAWLDNLEDLSCLDNVGRTALHDFLSGWQLLQRIADHERQHATDIARVLNISVNLD
jgi:hypothetical protein